MFTRWLYWSSMTRAIAIRATVITFWMMMNTLENTLFVCRRCSPFMMETGSCRKVMTAGISPEMTPTRQTISRYAARYSGEYATSSPISPAMYRLKTGSRALAKSSARTMHKATKTIDSETYRQSILPRDSPRVERMAISFDLLPASATLRLM